MRPADPSRASRTLSTHLAVCLVLAGLVLAVSCLPAAGQAHPAGAGLERGTNVWYGHVLGGEGERWYCGDPSAGGRFLREPFHEPGTGYGTVQHTTEWTPASDGGRPMAPEAVRTMAHLLATHAATDDDHTAAAAAWAIRTLSVSGGGTGDPTPAGDDLAAAGQAMIDDSTARRGPYVVTPVLEVGPSGTTATVTDYTARSKSTGVAVGGAPTLVVEGPAVFASTGTTTTVGDGSPVDLVSTGTGPVRVVATVTGLPSDRLAFRVPADPSFQRMLVAGQVVDVTGAATGEVRGFDDAAVTLTSTMLLEGSTPQFPVSGDDPAAVFAAAVQPGARVVDALWLDGALWREDLSVGFTGTVTAELVRLPPADGAGAAQDPPVVATVTVEVDTTDDVHWESTADGGRRTRRDAPYLTPAVTIPADARPGERFSWRLGVPEWSDVTHFGVARQPAVVVDAGVVTETTTIDRGRPRFTTQVSSSTVTLGESVSDHIAVAGLWSGIDGHGRPAAVEVVWAVHGPYPRRPDLTETCDQALLAGRGSIIVHGDGEIETPAFTPAAPGWYTFVTTSVQTDQNHAATTPCGEPAETFRVDAPVAAALPHVGASEMVGWLAVASCGCFGAGALLLRVGRQ
ncbi:hypothetical protein HMPREF0063_10726 [Aeromicrobium marinum DSM 15272]|uniref:Uncharacterized protein n=1 Tax=Aeromicrobium marinum DSM 15272 TaxID=585531 RepID=E2S9T6_9ACTN|nr:hypothetical protein [Aeromicrobium marinum]EFQ84010.1 hypothetical protein HMPREF0063_10726 [Aeromicrobium marinum DSM 15272]